MIDRATNRERAERCRIDASQQTDWYFFSHKDKKYPTGTRTNRATAAGFWKATGRDKAVHGPAPRRARIGMRKTLVFYRGRAPHGQKTDWIMHEYRLLDDDVNGGELMQLDDLDPQSASSYPSAPSSNSVSSPVIILGAIHPSIDAWSISVMGERLIRMV
jgi:hypothetical protein